MLLPDSVVPSVDKCMADVVCGLLSSEYDSVFASDVNKLDSSDPVVNDASVDVIVVLVFAADDVSIVDAVVDESVGAVDTAGFMKMYKV